MHGISKDAKGKEQMRHERRRGLPGRFWQRTSLNREDFLKPKSIGQAAPSIIMPFETFWTGYYDCHKKLW